MIKRHHASKVTLSIQRAGVREHPALSCLPLNKGGDGGVGGGSWVAAAYFEGYFAGSHLKPAE